MRLKNLQLIFLGILTFALTGCGVYSFSPGTVDPRVKTISINLFMNEAGGGPPTLPQTFTEKLRTFYQQNTRLDLVKSEGDWRLDGKIVGYQVVPVAPTGNERAGLNRLTIQVSVVFENTYNEKENFDQLFSFYADFPQNQTLSAVENELINTITDQIVFDIFTRTTSNW